MLGKRGLPLLQQPWYEKPGESNSTGGTWPATLHRGVPAWSFPRNSPTVHPSERSVGESWKLTCLSPGVTVALGVIQLLSEPKPTLCSFSSPAE